MRPIVDYLRRHYEPMSRREFRIIATIGITFAIVASCLLAYVRIVEHTRTPATWQLPHVDASDPVDC